MAKVKKNRSPNYPVINLKAAIDYAERLGKYANGMHPVPIESAAEEAWDMKPGSAYGKQVVAALKAYGLVIDEGVGDRRRVRITEVASKIIDGHSDRSRLIRDAAISPKIHGELWGMWKGNVLPPDATMREYLVHDRDGNRFNKASVDGFIKVFRETVSFANLTGDDIDAESNGEPQSDEPFSPSSQGGRESKGRGRFAISSPDGILPLPILMDDGSICIVSIPRMTEATFEFFKKQLDAYKMAIVVRQSGGTGCPDDVSHVS